MGALRSKDIADYEDAQLEDLRPDASLPVDLHLYFEKNAHLMIWVRSGESFTKPTLQKFRAQGISKVWIHKRDHDAFIEYLKGVPVAVLPASRPILPEAKEIVAAVKRDPQATAVATREGQTLLSNLAKPTNAAAQVKATARARRVIQDVLSQLSHEAGDVVQEIWKVAELDLSLQHSVNVATYATIFALAFGRIEEDLLGDVALAALLHDLGLSQIPSGVAMKSWKEHADEERAAYALHVDASLALLEELRADLDPGISFDRVRDIIAQHHEKFDGSGYPKHLEGFRLDDIPQLVALADMMDSMASGRWDGRARTIQETLSEIDALEKAKTFPEYFNPEVFAAVMRWIRSDSDAKLEEKTVKLVSKKTKDLVRKVKY